MIHVRPSMAKYKRLHHLIRSRKASSLVDKSNNAERYRYTD